MLLSGPSFSGSDRADAGRCDRPRGRTRRKPATTSSRFILASRCTAFDALAAAADKASIRFAGHVPLDVGLQRALQAKYWTIDHLDGYMEALAGPRGRDSENFGVNLMSRIDESRIAALAADTKAAGVWNVPTQILLENWYGPDSPEAMQQRPEMQYVRPAEVAQWMSRKAPEPRRLLREGPRAFHCSSPPPDQGAAGCRRRSAARIRCAAGLERPRLLDPPRASVLRRRRADAVSGPRHRHAQRRRSPRHARAESLRKPRIARWALLDSQASPGTIRMARKHGSRAARRQPAREHREYDAHRWRDDRRPLDPEGGDRSAAGGDAEAVCRIQSAECLHFEFCILRSRIISPREEHS